MHGDNYCTFLFDTIRMNFIIYFCPQFALVESPECSILMSLNYHPIARSALLRPFLWLRTAKERNTLSKSVSQSYNLGQFKVTVNSHLLQNMAKFASILDYIKTIDRPNYHFMNDVNLMFCYYSCCIVK